MSTNLRLENKDGSIFIPKWGWDDQIVQKGFATNLIFCVNGLKAIEMLFGSDHEGADIKGNKRKENSILPFSGEKIFIFGNGAMRLKKYSNLTSAYVKYWQTTL